MQHASAEEACPPTLNAQAISQHVLSVQDGRRVRLRMHPGVELVLALVSTEQSDEKSRTHTLRINIAAGHQQLLAALHAALMHRLDKVHGD